jgi:hypothetical protein
MWRVHRHRLDSSYEYATGDSGVSHTDDRTDAIRTRALTDPESDADALTDTSTFADPESDPISSGS